MEANVLFGGPQGSGVQSAADTFARIALRSGYYVFSEIAYASNIMGAHQYARVRVSDEPVHASRSTAEVVVAFDLETLVGDTGLRKFPTHKGHVHQATQLVVYDATLVQADWEAKLTSPNKCQTLALPFEELITQSQQAAGVAVKAQPILRNTVALGTICGLLEIDLTLAEEALRETFKGKKTTLSDLNVQVLQISAAHAKASTKVTLPTLSKRDNPGRLLVKGTQTSALGKLAAGVALQTYYPIAPATDESTYLEHASKEHNVLVVQCEDEAASACMLVGAAHVGVRSSTATSGPGFALMTEAIGVASEMEAPGIVFTLYQRSGPSTGMPTRYEQADLLWTLHPSQGEFSHMVVAPGDASELFEDTYRAFNWADKYQLPVVVLTDKHVASSAVTLDAFPDKPEAIDRGPLLEVAPANYFRYAGSGVSPRVLPGTKGGVFWTTSDEHDPEGHITEGVALRTHMMEKRMGKLDLALKEIAPDVAVATYGDAASDTVVLFWGASKGVILDTLKERERTGKSLFKAVQVRLMQPFPVEAVLNALGTLSNDTEQPKPFYVVEENMTGQLQELLQAKLVDRKTHCKGSIRKSDGRPLKVDELDKALDEISSSGTHTVKVVSDD